MLSDDLLKSDRICAATMRVVAKMGSAKGKDIYACATLIVVFCRTDCDSVVNAGALFAFVCGVLYVLPRNCFGEYVTK